MADMNSATPILASHCSSAIKWRQKWRSVGAKRERQTSVCRSTGGLSNRQKQHKKAMPLAAKRDRAARSRQEKKQRQKRSGKQFKGRKAWK
ncbi:hypothetical protein KFK09_022076 [Dendrobium nobile]|uniref:SDA1 C-terminal domain-containing protein n=1 Tax=Dendrobium nobile TaxID=94219 RepID=A0A8T3AHW2_DENNO|nr:hypothetical protein KFK09_022076 [Dendrobium nobile]